MALAGEEDQRGERFIRLYRIVKLEIIIIVDTFDRNTYTCL